MHVYTFRNENQYLAFDYGADPYKEYERFLQLGIDGFFTDFPGSLGNYLELLHECGTNTAAATSVSLLTPTVAFVVAQLAMALQELW